MKEKLFPYSVREEYAKLNDGICCSTVCNDNRCFHRHRCEKKIKEFIQGVGFCGVHARSIKKWLE